MAHFAHITNNIVDSVIVADQDFINSGLVGDALEWVQTSYNTRGGVHYAPNSDTPSDDQSKALRGNYAGVGYIYDQANDVFYPPQPYPSWTISAPTWEWQPPVPYPSTGGSYTWDEATQSWVLAPTEA